MDHNALGANKLAGRIAARYAGWPDASCAHLKSGCHETYTVSTATRTAVLKVYTRGYHRREALAAQAEQLAALSARGAPVVGPIQTDNGRYVIDVPAPQGKRDAILWTYAPGEKWSGTAEYAAQMGRTLARIHRVADTLLLDSRRPTLDLCHLVVEPMRAALRIGASSSHVAMMQHVAERAGEIVSRLPRAAPAYGFVHGDVGGYNQNRDSAGRMLHYDFEVGGTGWRAYDLSVLLWSRMLRRDIATAMPEWMPFFQAYIADRELSLGETHALPWFAACRHIWMVQLKSDLGGIPPGEESRYLAEHASWLAWWLDLVRERGLDVSAWAG